MSESRDWNSSFQKDIVGQVAIGQRDDGHERAQDLPNAPTSAPVIHKLIYTHDWYYMQEAVSEFDSSGDCCGWAKTTILARSSCDRPVPNKVQN